MNTATSRQLLFCLVGVTTFAFVTLPLEDGFSIVTGYHFAFGWPLPVAYMKTGYESPDHPVGPHWHLAEGCLLDPLLLIVVFVSIRFLARRSAVLAGMFRVILIGLFFVVAVWYGYGFIRLVSALYP